MNMNLSQSNSTNRATITMYLLSSLWMGLTLHKKKNDKGKFK